MTGLYLQWGGGGGGGMEGKAQPPKFSNIAVVVAVLNIHLDFIYANAKLMQKIIFCKYFRGCTIYQTDLGHWILTQA